MKIVQRIADVRDQVRMAGVGGSTVGFVPTMGYFHDGHLALMRKAREENGLVVVSLFVNPTQFGPDEDLSSYPRNLDRDAAMAEGVGVDLLFVPSVEEMYPDGCCTHVEVEGPSRGLCGASRPGHFKGVTTIVAKLLNIVQPDRAYFGMKDYQQLKVVERMARDLDVPVEIVAVPTVRDPDGLAMSSRNSYLSVEERRAALVVPKSLDYAEDLIGGGVRDTAGLRDRIRDFVVREPLARIDYVEVVDSESLEPLDRVEGTAVVAVAVRIGRTRLIDNRIVGWEGRTDGVRPSES